MSPPSSCASRREMASPSPCRAASNHRVVRRSPARTPRRCAPDRAGAIPTPVSVTCSAIHVRRASGVWRVRADSRAACRASGVGRGEPPTSRARTEMPPAGVYFTALPMRFTRICRRCVGSVRTRGSVAPTAMDRFRPRSLTSDSSSLATLSTNGRRTMRLRMDLQSTGGNLRDVEHLVDEMAQMCR